MRTALAFFVAAGLVAGGALYYARNTAATPPLRTTKVSRGDLRATLAATGTLKPEEVVDIGAQVVGQIKTLGLDPSDPAKKKIIDFGSIVHEGTVLALIDDSAYKAQVDNAEATLQRAHADLAQAQAKFDQAEEEWRRAKSLLPTNAIAQSDFDSVTANYRAALAYVASQKACVRQNEVLLRLARTNLDNTIIRSPVHGVILDRRASVGQTVVAAFNAPSLFLIAKDLRRMQVWASVDESDIGQVRTGMPVQFTVDTCPGEVFRGRVSQVRLKATTTGDSVAYTVVIGTDNSDGKLLPYLTADLQFELGQRSGVLLVPNAALCWRPRLEQVPPELRDAGLPTVSDEESENDRPSVADLSAEPTSSRASGRSHAEHGSEGGGHFHAERGSEGPEHGYLWVEDGRFVRPIEVHTGQSDGAMTEVSGQQVKEGLEVVVGQRSAAAQSTADAAEDRGSRIVDLPHGGRRGHRSRY
jgi:HlyD family secretion protein